MKTLRAGILAVRAVNQYRRRDILTFLGLRYYLANSASISDGWIRNIAVDLASSRPSPGYFNAQHFKDRGEDNLPNYRSLHVPGANEALAEAALLAECAKYPNVFGNPDCVFSYELTAGKSRVGVFEPYIKGLKDRHIAISKAIDNAPTGVVQYVDIKKFYPSISGDKATEVWNRCCDKANLDKPFALLGKRLIEDHLKIPRSNELGILTGPMFSHLLANLVLHDMDKELSQSLSVAYFRYVDDIILVGDEAAVETALQTIESKLSGLGLHLHPQGSEKRLRVPAIEWLEEASYYQYPKTQHSWASLIGDIKRFLLIQQGDHSGLRDKLRDQEFRLPIPDYSALIYEAGWLERFLQLTPLRWFKRKTIAVTVDSILNQAVWLRNHHHSQLLGYLRKLSGAAGYKRKCLIPKLRCSAGRLVYLANTDTMFDLGRQLLDIPELHQHGQIMLALASGQIDDLLPLGVNAVQAAAQAFAANGDIVTVTIRNFTPVERQGLVILIMNGVSIKASNGDIDDGSELMRIAQYGSDPELMKSDDPFIRELACLHGLATTPRHPEMFRTAFDQDDELALDAIDQLLDYPSP